MDNNRQLTNSEEKSIYAIPASERSFEQNMEVRIAERQSQVDVYSTPGSSVYESIELAHPGLRVNLIELFQEEIAALRSLDPSTATMEQANEISQAFSTQREALTK